MKPAVVRARVDRLRARVWNNEDLRYPELKADVGAALSLLDHHARDAAELRVEKAKIWRRVVHSEMRSHFIVALEWSVVAAVWSVAIVECIRVYRG